MDLQQFKKSMENLKEFFLEREKLDNVIKVISPTSTGVVEIGGKFIDDYIELISIALKDTENWVSWFVFDNEFGKKQYECKFLNKSYKICNEDDFYNFFMLIENETKDTK